MKNKKKIYYVYFITNKKNGVISSYRKKNFIIEEDRSGAINGIRIIVNRHLISSLNEKKDKRFERITREYDISDAVIIADKYLADKLEIADILFMARKKEFINNCDFITATINKRSHRSDSAVIVIGSGRWNVKDIYSILTVVRNYYKTIDVVMEYQMSGITGLAELVYNEWGIVLNLYPIKSYPCIRKDYAVFLIKRWRDYLKKKVPFETAYVVTDDDSFVEDHDHFFERNGTMYMGLKYVSDGNVEDTLCTQMTWQKPLLCEKFHVSVIDICELK